MFISNKSTQQENVGSNTGLLRFLQKDITIGIVWVPWKHILSSKAWARICGPTPETRGQILISTFKLILSDLAVTTVGPLRLYALILISKLNFVDPAGLYVYDMYSTVVFRYWYRSTGISFLVFLKILSSLICYYLIVTYMRKIFFSFAKRRMIAF